MNQYNEPIQRTIHSIHPFLLGFVCWNIFSSLAVLLARQLRSHLKHIEPPEAYKTNEKRKENRSGAGGSGASTLSRAVFIFFSTKIIEVFYTPSVAEIGPADPVRFAQTAGPGCGSIRHQAVGGADQPLRSSSFSCGTTAGGSGQQEKACLLLAV